MLIKIIRFENYMIVLRELCVFSKYYLCSSQFVLTCILYFSLQNHRSDVADLTPLLRVGLVSDELIFLLG